MSGGSLDYVCFKVDEAADRIASRSLTPLQQAFAAHLRLVGKALHDLEWVWSGDYGPGDEEEAIRAVLAPHAELEQVTKEAREAAAALNEILDRTEGAGT